MLIVLTGLRVWPSGPSHSGSVRVGMGWLMMGRVTPEVAHRIRMPHRATRSVRRTTTVSRTANMRNTVRWAMMRDMRRTYRKAIENWLKQVKLRFYSDPSRWNSIKNSHFLFKEMSKKNT